jgi:hypothetical protein
VNVRLSVKGIPPSCFHLPIAAPPCKALGNCGRADAFVTSFISNTSSSAVVLFPVSVMSPTPFAKPVPPFQILLPLWATVVAQVNHSPLQLLIWYLHLAELNFLFVCLG